MVAEEVAEAVAAAPPDVVEVVAAVADAVEVVAAVADAVEVVAAVADAVGVAAESIRLGTRVIEAARRSKPQQSELGNTNFTGLCRNQSLWYKVQIASNGEITDSQKLSRASMCLNRSDGHGHSSIKSTF